MKHTIPVTVILISIFFLTQIFGLFLVKEDITSVEEINGTIVINHGDTAIGPRPETTGYQSFLYVALAVFIGTLLVLLIIKYGKANLWKMWFFLAVFLSITISIGVFVNVSLAFFLAFILAVLKLTKRNILIHNLTEVLMYSGLAVLIVPLFDLAWAFMLLIAISLYDMYAVWKSKHMVKMAEFQTKNKLFAGLMIPYKPKGDIELKIPQKPAKAAKKKSSGKKKKKGPTNAILGGGDVAFPLIFAGVVMEELIRDGLSLSASFFQASIIGVTATIAIMALFWLSKKDKFYPAMPTVTFGCIVGYAIVLLL